MLQQTQVDRVVPYFVKWMRKFPTVEKLARSDLANVLREWSGLGYNRRAKMLRECAKEIVEKHGGKVPKDFAALVSLPGIGPYTAGAIRAFAFNEKEIFVETNIRAALIHHFFPKSKKVDDKKLIPILKQCLALCRSGLHNITPRAKTRRRRLQVGPREWYSALMDYGAYIKKTNPNPSRRSKHHAKQSKFEGSLRQVRGAILRQLLKSPIKHGALLKVDAQSSYRLELALKDLSKEGLIEKRGSTWRLSSN